MGSAFQTTQQRRHLQREASEKTSLESSVLKYFDFHVIKLPLLISFCFALKNLFLYHQFAFQSSILLPLINLKVSRDSEIQLNVCKLCKIKAFIIVMRLLFCANHWLRLEATELPMTTWAGGARLTAASIDREVGDGVTAL